VSLRIQKVQWNGLPDYARSRELLRFLEDITITDKDLEADALKVFRSHGNVSGLLRPLSNISGGYPPVESRMINDHIKVPNPAASTKLAKTTATEHDAPVSQLPTPLIVWVDDRPQNNRHLVEFAQSEGVHVIELESTALAKAWIEANRDFVRQNEAGHQIRFISDNARYESGASGTFLNTTAGETMLRYLRDRRFPQPVLIFCGGGSIPYTEYVTSFESAGSTIFTKVAKRFISEMKIKGSSGPLGFNLIE